MNHKIIYWDDSYKFVSGIYYLKSSIIIAFLIVNSYYNSPDHITSIMNNIINRRYIMTYSAFTIITYVMIVFPILRCDMNEQLCISGISYQKIKWIKYVCLAKILIYSTLLMLAKYNYKNSNSFTIWMTSVAFSGLIY